MIYTKTQSGQIAFQKRSVLLTPRQRSAFILFDGKRTISEVMGATAGLGVTPEDVSHLVSLGLLEAAVPALEASGVPVNTALGSLSATEAFPLAAESADLDVLPSLSVQAHFLKAYPIATRLTAGLGLRGFRLNLAVEAAGDLSKLKELSFRIREAVGPDKFLELERALYD